MTDDIRARLSKVDACAVSDALDALGLDGATTGLHSVSVAKQIVGRAVTVDLADYDGTPSSRHLGTAAVDASGPGDVIVVAGHGRRTVAGWGGVLSAGASVRHVVGIVVDGAARDVDQATEYGLAVYAAAAVTRSARGRVVERAWNVPVSVAGVTVCPGDWVIADGSGVVFVPAGHIGEVLAKAEAVVARETLLAARALTGEPLAEVMGRDYESMLNGGGR